MIRGVHGILVNWPNDFMTFRSGSSAGVCFWAVKALVFNGIDRLERDLVESFVVAFKRTSVFVNYSITKPGRLSMLNDNAHHMGALCVSNLIVPFTLKMKRICRDMKDAEAGP
jgi:hypothetical protein